MTFNINLNKHSVLAFNPSTPGGRGRRISEFEASLVYRVSSRTARTIQRNPVSKNQKKKKKKKKKKEREGPGGPPPLHLKLLHERGNFPYSQTLLGRVRLSSWIRS